MELMAGGLPVVVDMDNNFFGDDFYVENGVHFIKAENRNPEYLAGIFIKLFENPSLRQKIGENAKVWVTETMSYDNISSKLENVYTDVLKKRLEKK